MGVRGSVIGIFCFCLLLCLPGFARADHVDHWHWRNPLPQGKPLYGIAYGSGTFVAVGEYIVLTSPDGVDWTMRPSGSTYVLRSIAYDNGIFVAVGTTSPCGCGDSSIVILTSPDGIDWTVRSSDASGYLRDVVYGNGIFVTVGAIIDPSGEMRVMTSPDGLTWTVRSAGNSDLLRTIGFGGGTFVVAGAGGTILTSHDGINWTVQAADPEYAVDGIAYGAGLFVAVGGGVSGSDIRTSSDGITWTKQASYLSDVILYDVTYSNGVFVVVGSSGAILTSADGAIWAFLPSRTLNSLFGVAYGNDTFVAVGNSGSILQSDSAGGNCAATLNEDFSLHLPAVLAGDQVYWADFAYVPNTADFYLIDAGVVSDMSPFDRCSPSSLSSDFKLHLPSVMYNGVSYWAAMIYGQGTKFSVSRAGRN